MLDLIICVNFGVKKLRDLGNTRGQILEFPTEMAGHHYNSAAQLRSLWFKMAAAAILILLFLSILVKWSIFRGSRLHFCKISFIYVNRWLSYCWFVMLCVKIKKMVAVAMLNFIFVQFYGTTTSRISNLARICNFVQVRAITTKLWAINGIQNGGRRHLEFIIFVHIGQTSHFL